MQKKFDVIVIGAGPSGMMAALTAQTAGARVLLIEKNKQVGKKLLLTGGGRCNVTNNKTVPELIAHIPGNGKFLFSTFHQFDAQDVIAFFEGRGVALKEEDHGRMFPTTDKSKTIVAALVAALTEAGVTLQLNCAVEKLITTPENVQGVRTALGDFSAPCVIISTGGMTYQATGSTGSGYKLAKSVGHTVTPLYATEAPLVSDDPFIKARTLQGLALKNITLRVLNQKNTVVVSQTLDLLFTHFGLSGPAALRCSSYINQLLKDEGQPVKVAIDCLPDLSLQEVVQLFATAATNSKKSLKNAWAPLLPERYLTFLLTELNLQEKMASQLLEKETLAFAQLVKNFTLTIVRTFPLEKAFVTGGGVSLKEVQPKTLESKLLPGLFFTGEVLDINGFTGGYNITAAFCTGHVAGNAAAVTASYLAY